MQSQERAKEREGAPQGAQYGPQDVSARDEARARWLREHCAACRAGKRLC